MTRVCLSNEVNIMVSKIAISISEELRRALENVAESRDLSRSRLIEICLRENPNIIKEIGNYQLKEAIVCEKCKAPFGPNDIKIDTPKYGVICKHCWSSEMGKVVEEHPISNI